MKDERYTFRVYKYYERSKRNRKSKRWATFSEEIIFSLVSPSSNSLEELAEKIIKTAKNHTAGVYRIIFDKPWDIEIISSNLNKAKNLNLLEKMFFYFLLKKKIKR